MRCDLANRVHGLGFADTIYLPHRMAQPVAFGPPDDRRIQPHEMLPPPAIEAADAAAYRKGGGLGPFFGLHPSSAKG
jgi:hypothetical protein